MSLIKYGNGGHLAPWHPLRDLDREFERLLGDLARPFTDVWSPAVDLRETEKEYIVEMDVPGMTKDDIHLDITGDVLTVSGERLSETEQKEGEQRRIERRYGKFQRSFEVAGGFEQEKVNAEYKDGVLKVTLPKRPEQQPKRIEVKVH